MRGGYGPTRPSLALLFDGMCVHCSSMACVSLALQACVSIALRWHVCPLLFRLPRACRAPSLPMINTCALNSRLRWQASNVASDACQEPVGRHHADDQHLLRDLDGLGPLRRLLCHDLAGLRPR
jgi:hypothetical protein